MKESPQRGGIDRPAVAPEVQPPQPANTAGIERLSQEQIQRLALPDDVVDWLGFIRRQWLVMIVVFIVVIASAVAILKALPKQYESSAKFLVKNARQDLVVGPNETATAVYRDDVSEEIMNTELELLRSRDILAQVVSELGLDRHLVEQGTAPEMASELATRGLGGQLRSTALRKTNMVQISYESPDAQLSAKVVQHVADAYLAAHLTIHSNPGTYELFQRQAADASVELRKAEEELAALARSSNLVILDTQKQEALRSVQELSTQLQALEAEMREQDTRARIAELHMTRVPQRVATQRRNLPNQASSQALHTMLVELQNKRTEALTKFNPTDRLVVELDKQIADTTAAMERSKNFSGVEESSDINPAWQALENERMKARLQFAGSESKSAQLKKELADMQSRTLQITEAGPRYEQLSRNVSEARNRYELYAKKEEEARIAEVLDRQRISNVVLAQGPFVSHVPSSPNVRLGLIVAVLVAGALGMAAGFARDFFGSRTPKPKRRSSQVTVLGINPTTAELP